MRMAVTLEEAIQIVRDAFKTDYQFEKIFFIDSTRIADKGIAWFIPFRVNGYYGGGSQGCFVDKTDGDLMITGSGLPISMYFTGFKLGVRYETSNLIIKKVNDPDKTLELLLALHLKYIIPEEKDGVIWKTAQPFTDEMILKKLKNLPCTFYNQNIFGAIRQFQRIVRSKDFEYEIIEVKHPPKGEYGENLLTYG
jgi:hypothetical protein